jgi:radical SAM protein with 4Fe4S-binding SPASM domain
MWAAHARGDTRLPYPPLEVWIEPTNHCNLRCVKCPHTVGLKRAKGFMEPAAFRRVVDEITPYAFTVSLHLGGESLLHRGFPDLVAYAAGRGLRTILHTNVTLLTESLSRRLVASGLDLISFSMDGEDGETYAAVDLGGNFGKCLENIRTFLRVRAESGRRRPLAVVQYLRVLPGMSPDPARSPLLALGADYLRVADAHAWSGAFAASSRDLVPVRPFEAVRDGRGRGPTSGAKAATDGDGYAPCHNLWYGIAVFWNGDVAPCCMDMEGEYPVGNLSTSRLLDLWNGDRIVSLRRAQVERRMDDLTLCRDCAYLWGKTPGSAWRDLRGRIKEELRLRAPALARRLGAKPYGIHDWNG